jgi:hypothetical protein
VVSCDRTADGALHLLHHFRVFISNVIHNLCPEEQKLQAIRDVRIRGLDYISRDKETLQYDNKKTIS